MPGMMRPLYVSTHPILLTKLYNGIDITSNGIIKLNITKAQITILPLKLNFAKANAAIELIAMLKITVTIAMKKKY